MYSVAVTAVFTLNLNKTHIGMYRNRTWKHLKKGKVKIVEKFFSGVANNIEGKRHSRCNLKGRCFGKFEITT